MSESWFPIWCSATNRPDPVNNLRRINHIERAIQDIEHRMANWQLFSKGIPMNGLSTTSRLRRSSGILRITVIACLLGLSYAALVQRSKILRSAPWGPSAIAALGFPINLDETEFRSVRARIDLGGSERTLVIEGEIVNLRNDTNSVSDIKLSLLDDSGRVTYSWIAPLPSKSLRPNERLTFRVNLASPPTENRRLKISFAV